VRRLLKEPPSTERLLAWVEEDSGCPVTDPSVAAWLRDVARVTVRGQGAARELRLLSGPPSEKNARRRLEDALDADELIGALFAIRDPVRAAQVRAWQERERVREQERQRIRKLREAGVTPGVDLRSLVAKSRSRG
jgi:hypothetical protein